MAAVGRSWPSPHRRQEPLFIITETEEHRKRGRRTDYYLSNGQVILRPFRPEV